MNNFDLSTSPGESATSSKYTSGLAQDFDPLDEDALDSNSSSSSGDHSSPSSDLAYPSSTGANWAYDLGLSVQGAGGIPRDAWGSPVADQRFGTKGGAEEGQFTAEGMLSRPDDVALMSDFWSTAPNTAVHTPMETKEFDSPQLSDSHSLAESSRSDPSGEMQVDFDSGPLSSARSSTRPQTTDSAPPCPTSRSVPSDSEPSFYPGLSSTSTNDHLDLSTVDAGIAPQLTGGQISPSLGPADRHWDPDADEDQHFSRAASDSEEEGKYDNGDERTFEIGQSQPSWTTTTKSEKKAKATQAKKSTHGASVSGPASRESSQSRKGLSTSTTASSTEQTTSTNFVTMDAIVASSVISTLATPPRTSSGLKLFVLGVPTLGAKSRVETQIKVSLVLVAPKSSKVKNEDDEGMKNFVNDEGGLRAGAGKDVVRVGSWSHLRLPRYLALKKTKKSLRVDPDLRDTLSLEVKVVSASDPSEEISICTGCQARERKRSQRKKEAKTKPGEEPENEELDEEEEKRKVVVFNSPEFIDFAQGETILPTRITCYCRHHKEKIGFVITFSLRDPAGKVVASGASPPIMITDDHKTPGVRNSTANSTANSTINSADVSFAADTSLDAPEQGTSSSKPKKAAKPAKRRVKKEKAYVPPFPVPTLPVNPDTPLGLLVRPMRTAARRAIERGLAEPEDDVLATVASTSGTTRTTKKFEAPKPYDSDSRPRKRQSGVHKSPSFAMTPVTATPSKPNSPTLAPVPDSQAPHQTFESMNYSSALGLGGMHDSMMTMEDGAALGRRSSAPSYSTASSSNASPGPSYDWRSSGSSPGLSPRDNSSHQSDPFASFFESLEPSHDDSFTSSHLPHSQLQSAPDFEPMYSPSGLIPLGGGNRTLGWGVPVTRPAPPPPRISRLIPGEGPVHGGIEVTVLGENFVPDLVCVFGEAAAVPTHFWSSSTLVCILPPSANPGPVVVGIKGVPLGVELGSRLQLFTYKDDSDRSLLELALQVVGLKMTGKLEDATAVALRIVGNSRNPSAVNTPSSSRHTSPSASNDAAGLATRMNAASASVYSTPASSRPPSRQASLVNLAHYTGSPPTSNASLPFGPATGETRNFEGIVIKFLSLLDLDPSAIPGSTQFTSTGQSSISFLNTQRHSLLHLATVLGFHRLVAFLLARGIDIESADRNGYTALHFAALYGRVSITRQLLEAGATVYARNFAGQTPLDIARAKDDVDVEDLFLRSRPLNPSLPNDYRSRPSTSTPIVQRPAAPSRASSVSHTPVSRYSPPESESDEFESEESDSDSDDDDESFHSSDEDGATSDVERGRGLSRNPSLVSLHYLLEAESEVGNDHAYPTPPPEERPHPEDVKEAAPLSTTTAIHDLASASSAWLSRTLRPSYPPPPKSTTPGTTSAPSSGVTAVWEKIPTLPYANNAWEKMRLPTGFVLPIQMPVAAFPSMPHIPASFSPSTWMGTKSDLGVEPIERDEGGAHAPSESKAAKDWRALYGPWWQTSTANKLSSSPPPMYTPTDTFPHPCSAPTSAPNSPAPSTSLLPPLPGSPSQKGVALQLRQRLGYVPEEISEAVVRSSVHHEKKMAGLKQDRMLFFFWLPILLFALGFVAYSITSHGSLLSYLEGALPYLRTIPNVPFIRT